ncbi:MAG: ABC transporter permease [Myxococcota bacterium]
MIVREAIREALRTLAAQKLRAALTLFGFVWGTAAVIFLVAWGDGVRTMLDVGFAKTGRNLGVIDPGTLGVDYVPITDRRYVWFDVDDLEAVRARAKWPALVGGEEKRFAMASFGQTAFSVDLRGVEPETIEIRGVPIEAGRGITRTDLRRNRRVVVLGAELRRELLGAHGGLGSWVRIDGTPFEVVGILAPVGVQLNRDGRLIDDQAWVPLATYHSYWPRTWTEEAVVGRILYQARDRRFYETTRDEIRAILADRLGVPRTDHSAIDSWSPMERLNALPVDQMRGLMFVIAATTLMIGGVGILTMMLDSVQERRTEIGVRLAVGARRRDVLVQFFIESMVVSVIGGVLGVALGILSCAALAALDLPDVVPVPELSVSVIAIALGVMTATGFAAALLPAWRAVGVAPSVTLRME